MYKIITFVLVFVSLQNLSQCASLTNEQSLLNNEDLLNKWNLYKRNHSFRFGNFEEGKKFETFKSNYFKILQHNKEFEENKHKYKTSLNQFSILTHEEFLKTKIGTIPSNKTAQVDEDFDKMLPPSIQLDYSTNLPENFDWRDYNLVSTPENQYTCGSCWAFATAGTVETVFARKYNLPVRRFSEQELVDCVSGNWGCDGGFPTTAFAYARTYGLVDESVYPYKSRVGYCQKNIQRRYKIRGYGKIPYGDEVTLKRVVATYGPVAVGIDASSWGFSAYSGGIFSSSSCSKDVQNHAVIVVGYGTDKGNDYWIVKNSWGPNWGANGYIYIARNQNMCGIASLASYPYM